mmetsp:Transcript_16377/g.46760  ORF Transcript_16377/g.46760 Transcript_16377/m.46760 type:complete len:949 (-) Transcript_16377:148-2994(-)|eukprot:CAMPEP_0179230504 /NCGR_PEP_ID=MMETSP0797-20121207/10868_1 /TAXON_ID=47934 /ORGANISM="Dinophysis acuminata, Strain DAEP01" /LENGTH=948 /DNA_ID=CAMNT_0020937575 /DNA_START=64 /DNA_END=2910 /DNA_ORIENTATION=-
MPGRFRAGTLVEISKLKEDVKDLEDATSTPFSANGKKAQLLSYIEGEKKWLAMTFDGAKIKVSDDAVTALQGDALSNVDFVLGPVCNEEILAQGMTDELVRKGYCVCTKLIPRKDVSRMQELAPEMKFDRAPAEFEPYYLGRDSKEKTVLLDFEAEDIPDAVRNSPFAVEDSSMGALCGSLMPYLHENLGITVTSRTNLMVRQTFASTMDEIDNRPQSEPSNAEKESFMGLMNRKRVCLMQFLGPLTGELTLIPKGDADAEEIEIAAAPHTMVLFLTERFQYSHTCSEGATMALQTWFLGLRPEFQMGEIGGDMEVLGASATGAPPPTGENVAINGIATYIGGDSKDYQCYWLMVNKGGGDTFVEVPMTRWDINTYCMSYDMQAAQLSGLSYTKHQGYVDGIEYFDAKFFGISNSEAASMDPNQRKTLETTYEALHMGGHDLKSLQREPKHIGCFVGISGSEWGGIPHPQDAAGCGGAEAIISNRCNFSFNLKGSSQTINTACSAGLVAMHTGKLHLKYKDFDPLDASLASGINLAFSPFPFLGCCSGGMLSFKGRSFTFDVSADGYGRGEGTSAVYMNLEKYNRDIFALVAGSQSNQDGRSASITAPNGPSQEKCIKAAFREAGLQPPEVDCFECHGTGTALGDPIEVGAFKRIYNSAPRSHTLLVTTSKTNLGHLEGGAGMAGFVKCCLQVMRAEASPNLHLRETNPHLDSEGFPSYFISEGLCCQYDSAYSGVSSFGFGGTNAHAMAYGKNTTTSRGTGQRDFRVAMREKIASAPPPEIMMHSDDPEDWESNGMPVSEDKIGKTYQVEILEGGKAVWREIVGMAPASTGERFYLSGSFNHFGMDQMVESESIPNLYTLDIELGPMGEAAFHVVCDEDPYMVYYPAAPRCTRKAVPIVGPGPVQGDREEATWCILAEPGARYRVEFFHNDYSTSVTWLRIADEISS